MLGYLEGTIKQVSRGEVLVVVNGVGYWAKVNSNINFKLGEAISLYIYTLIRKENIILYGFRTKKEMDMFKLLISVNSIGPSLAMGLLELGVDQLTEAIETENLVLLGTVSGLGKKRAHRLIIDLKGELELSKTNISTDLEIALRNLGYSKDEVKRVLPSIKQSEIGEMIKEALKKLC